MVRWAWVLLALLVIGSTAVAAHKSPIIEYGKAGVWRTEYTFQPRQPVVNEPIRVIEHVEHYEGTIKGNVTVVFSIYEDDSRNPWYNGKQYKELNWVLIKSAPGQPLGDNTFYTDVIIDRPGNYFITVDLYENGQYIGQDMRSLDVEQRTVGPLYVTFSALILAGVLFGVKRRIL